LFGISIIQLEKLFTGRCGEEEGIIIAYHIGSVSLYAGDLAITSESGGNIDTSHGLEGNCGTIQNKFIKRALGVRDNTSGDLVLHEPNRSPTWSQWLRQIVGFYNSLLFITPLNPSCIALLPVPCDFEDG
jgi:hypothetical protein